jgi:hypothetical protein
VRLNRRRGVDVPAGAQRLDDLLCDLGDDFAGHFVRGGAFVEGVVDGVCDGLRI